MVVLWAAALQTTVLYNSELKTAAGRNVLKTMDIQHKIKKLMFPQLSADLTSELDREALRGIYYSSIAVFIAEAISSVIYIATHAQLTANTVASVGSALTCCGLCLVGHFAAKLMLARWPRSHQSVVLFQTLYFIVLSAWGAFESALHYMVGDQMLTFFAVEFVMASFLIIKPWISALLVGSAYTGLYIALRAIDGAAHADTYNFLVFMLVTIAGMVVRFHVQREATQRAIKLEYVSTHDELTGLLNRDALDRDAQSFIGRDLAIRILDVNYFKEINDTHGHLMGDQVLREAAGHLGSMYPSGKIYRFGGDEFLIICNRADSTAFGGDTYRFDVEKDGEKIDVAFSIGCVVGMPSNKHELLTLVELADRELYRVKARTHGNAKRA